MREVPSYIRAVEAAIVACLLLMTVAACGDGAEPGSATTTTTTGQADEVSVPEEFPEPQNVLEFDVLTLTEEDVHVQWEVGTDSEEVVDFYSRALPDEGWQISSQREGGDSTRFGITGHGWDGAVTVLGGDPVRVLLQLGMPGDE